MSIELMTMKSLTSSFIGFILTLTTVKYCHKRLSVVDPKFSYFSGKNLVYGWEWDRITAYFFANTGKRLK